MDYEIEDVTRGLDAFPVGEKALQANNMIGAGNSLPFIFPFEKPLFLLEGEALQ